MKTHPRARFARQIINTLDDIDAAREIEVARELPDGSIEMIVSEGPDNSVLHHITIKSFYPGARAVLARLR